MIGKLLTSNAENVKAFIILGNVVSQRHIYDKKKQEKAHTKPEKKPTQISLQVGYRIKKCKR